MQPFIWGLLILTLAFAVLGLVDLRDGRRSARALALGATLTFALSVAVSAL
jgi:hypothetical protein